MNNVTSKDLYEGKSWIKAPARSWDARFNGASILIALDIFSYFTSISLSYLIRFPQTNIENVLFSFTHVPYFLILFCVLQTFDSYNTKDLNNNFSLAARSMLSALFIIPGIFLFDYLFGVYDFNFISGRGIAIIFSLCFTVMTTLHRFIYSNFLVKNAGIQRWGFFGTVDEFNIFIKDSQKSFRSYFFHFEYLGELNKFEKELLFRGLILSPSQSLKNDIVYNQILRYRMNNGEVLNPYEFSEKYWLRIPLGLINKNIFCMAPGFNIKTNTLTSQFKRIFDFYGSIFLLLLSLPILILTSILIKITDSGPVFYYQIRTGLHGKKFKIIKFRSMRIDAEKNGVKWASKNDKRVTWIGRFIRKTRIDEIPQFINVIKGEMSIIGPRPERPEIEKKLVKTVPYYSLRHQVRPGITGWAQVLYPYGSCIADTINKLEHELYYIKNQSLILDFAIMLKTIKIIIFRNGR